MDKSFSKLTKEEKIEWVAKRISSRPEEVIASLREFWYKDSQTQELLDNFSENTLSNFSLPFGVAPHFLINNKEYIVPMVIEESSVVAAASSAAKYWKERGGIFVETVSMRKEGQVHFIWRGDFAALQELFPLLTDQLRQDSGHLLTNMEKRGGGILNFAIIEFPEEPCYYQLKVQFDTCDSMGANFINTLLEQFALTLKHFFAERDNLPAELQTVEVIMAILSNYTPECIVRAEVSCPVSELGRINNTEAAVFAGKFHKAVRIAEMDVYRATTHNKGIYNGVDAVVIATGNDFRAIEACGHAYASRNGQYSSLSHCTLRDGIFRFWLELPLAVGTVGGLTSLHPLAKLSLEILGRPTAEELMKIIAAVGLVQNFAALRSLVTTGIQKGHMKMHLLNILKQLNADESEICAATRHFENEVISFSSVRSYLESLRSKEYRRN